MQEEIVKLTTRLEEMQATYQWLKEKQRTTWPETKSKQIGEAARQLNISCQYLRTAIAVLEAATNG